MARTLRALPWFAPNDVEKKWGGLPLVSTWAAVKSEFVAADPKNGEREAVRWLCRTDRFYLLTVACNRKDAWHPWLYARCREVESSPDGHIDLWAREHYKSTIITFAGCIQEMLRDPEITIGIFSHTKPVARKFLIQIKGELEQNALLKWAFPDILWADPRKDALKWSEEKGIQVRRAGNAKESTVEAHGLVDGMPTGAHFRLRVYDDVVTLESVSTPEQVEKTTNAWGLSDNLGAAQPDGSPGRVWMPGTRYHFGDTYAYILERKLLKPRVYPATADGTRDGRPVFLSELAWEEKKRTQPTAILACQMLQNPSAGTQALFEKQWLRFTDIRPATLNVYIMCDPASSRKKGSDNTAIMVVGVDAALNRYLLDGYRHKMSLSERWTAIRQLRRHWSAQPGIQSVKVGYERYGSTSDMEYFEEQMQKPGAEAFEIVELAWPREGPGSKYDRIQRLEPDFRNGKFWLALASDGETANQKRMRESGLGFRVLKPVKRMDHDGNLYSLNKVLLEEYLVYPYAAHDDSLDSLSRIYDMEPVGPVVIDERSLEPTIYEDGA